MNHSFTPRVQIPGGGTVSPTTKVPGYIIGFIASIDVTADVYIEQSFDNAATWYTVQDWHGAFVGAKTTISTPNVNVLLPPLPFGSNLFRIRTSTPVTGDCDVSFLYTR